MAEDSDQEDDSMEDPPAVVIDNGSFHIKAGYANDENPTLRFRTANPDTNKNPMSHSVITDWDEMEKIWQRVFDDLEVDELEYTPVLLTESPNNGRKNREKTAQIMFECFDVSQIFIQKAQTLALIRAGKTTGVVMDIGGYNGFTVPMYEGFALPHAIHFSDLAGETITQNLFEGLSEDYPTLTLEQTRELKEKHCYVSLDFENESENPTPVTYKLPDDTEIVLEEERFQSCEFVYFQSGMIDKEQPSLAKQIFDTINKSDIDIRKDLFHNVVLAGGATMFPGLDKRITRDLKDLAPAGTTVKVISKPEKADLAFAGGCVWCDIPSTEDQWIFKSEYEENGPSVMHRKLY